MYGDKGPRSQKTLNIKWQKEVKGRRVLTHKELPWHFLIATLTSGVRTIKSPQRHHMQKGGEKKKKIQAMHCINLTYPP